MKTIKLRLGKPSLFYIFIIMKKADNFNPAKWLVENKITFQSKLNEIDREDWGDPRNQPDEEEADLFTASIMKKGTSIPGYEDQTYMSDTLVGEDGEEFGNYRIYNTYEEAVAADGTNIYTLEDKYAVTFPDPESKSEFYGKFNEGDLKKYKGLNAALALINEAKKKTVAVWDKNSIEDFFKFITKKGIKVKYFDFTKGTNGEVQIKINRSMYEAEFYVNYTDKTYYLVFKGTRNSDVAPDDFLDILDKKGVDQKYDYFSQGNLAIISFKEDESD